MKKICEICCKEFITHDPSSRYCSNECYKVKISNKIKVICAECGKVEFVTPSRAKKYKCCSVECLGKYNSKRYNKQVTLICPICGIEYKCKQSKIKHHRTCGGSNCRKEWLKQTRKGENNSNYNKVEVDVKNNSNNSFCRVVILSFDFLCIADRRCKSKSFNSPL